MLFQRLNEYFGVKIFPTADIKCCYFQKITNVTKTRLPRFLTMWDFIMAIVAIIW